jgi:hypothetical protein
VAMMVVLLEAADDEPRLGEAALGELKRLGVTSIELLRDDGAYGLVLEGWAFDPERSRTAALAAVGAAPTAQALLPLVHMAVTASPEGDPL